MKLTPRKKMLYAGLVIIAAIVGLIFFESHSEPFEHATRWAKQSPEVRQAVGDVVEVSTFPWSFYVRSNDTRGFAQYDFTVTGTRGEAKMHVRLQKDLGNWRVVEATLNGSELSKLE
jgi:hypothetical protein